MISWWSPKSTAQGVDPLLAPYLTDNAKFTGYVRCNVLLGFELEKDMVKQAVNAGYRKAIDFEKAKHQRFATQIRRVLREVNLYRRMVRLASGT